MKWYIYNIDQEGRIKRCGTYEADTPEQALVNRINKYRTGDIPRTRPANGNYLVLPFDTKLNKTVADAVDEFRFLKADVPSDIPF